MGERIEEIILRHSGRGMDVLKEYLDADYCRQAAKEILSWKRDTVLLTTGFYVAGYAETDGPAGTCMLAKALDALGYAPVIVTDSFCRGFFEPEGIRVLYMDITDDAAEQERQADAILDAEKPVGMISIERCGINTRNDFENMRGISIKEHTARTDLLFLKAPERRIPTIGVGDGGNEIGMGNLQDVIREKLSLVPCAVPCDHLVIASVSNWGAYGLAAWLEKCTGEPVFPDYAAVNAFIEKTVEIGSVDGVTHERVPHVDGFSQDVEEEIVDALGEAVKEI
ncbi:MAG: DUF4392 domain-containing protein [Lachnospiraceae bacterium]|nr:DUF4392 domain-containing protein [Lachnospiraceae bacterium]